MKRAVQRRSSTAEKNREIMINAQETDDIKRQIKELQVQRKQRTEYEKALKAKKDAASGDKAESESLVQQIRTSQATRKQEAEAERELKRRLDELNGKSSGGSRPRTQQITAGERSSSSGRVSSQSVRAQARQQPYPIGEHHFLYQFCLERSCRTLL